MGFLDKLKKRMTTPGAEAFEEERFRESRPEFLKEGLPPAGSETTDITSPYLFDAVAAARRRQITIVVGVLLLILLTLSAAGAYLGVRAYRAARTVQKEQIQLSLATPERVISGDEIALQLKVENGSHVGWENVVVELQAPEGFRLSQAVPSSLTTSRATPSPEQSAPQKSLLAWSVGTLPPRAHADFRISGRLFGEEGSTALFAAKATLTPATRPGERLEQTFLGSVTLSGIPVDLTIDLPLRTSSGLPITVQVAYQNRTTKDLQNTRIALEAPPGFSVTGTTPLVQGRELRWDLPPAPPQGGGAITVTGIIDGEPDQVKPFIARVGFLTPDGQFLVQRQIQRSVTIAQAALSLTQVLNREEDLLKVNPGAEVAGFVRYKNTGTAGLREVIVRMKLEGTGLDVSSVRADGGFFDSRQKEITWSAASAPALRALRPGQSGQLGFHFRVLPVEALPFARESDRNFTITTQAVGDSTDIPAPPGAPKVIPTDRFEILVNTVPTLTLDAFYDDGRAGLPPSTGPLPPTVEQETILTVKVRVGNTSNEIIDAVYGTILPEGVRWVGKEYHTTGEITFNPRTKDVTWTLTLVPARAGTGLPGPEFAYQVAIRPSLNQLEQELPLTKGHVLEGTDAFTTVRVRAEAPAVSTRTVDDQKSKVVR